MTESNELSIAPEDRAWLTSEVCQPREKLFNETPIYDEVVTENRLIYDEVVTENRLIPALTDEEFKLVVETWQHDNIPLNISGLEDFLNENKEKENGNDTDW